MAKVEECKVLFLVRNFCLILLFLLCVVKRIGECRGKNVGREKGEGGGKMDRKE